jgi:hypothetical protein
MTTTFCLDCDRVIDLGADIAIGQRVRCSNCEVDLEIINLEPLELDWVYDGPITRRPLDEFWVAKQNNL